MTSLWHVFLHMLRGQRRALLRGAALSALVLLMGTALLGLSGWFITAAAAAGLAGLGAVFDVFRPSASVRLLALGRTAARYGERLLTHDATLRALAGLRVSLLRALAAAPFDRLIRVRGAQALNRITADVDALDGIPLRLVLPVAAALTTLGLAFLALWALVDLRVAALVVGIYMLGSAGALWRGARAAMAPSRRAETASQAFRSRLIDLIGARADLALYGQLDRQQAEVRAADARRRAAADRLDRLDRTVGAALSLTSLLALMGALALGGHLAATDQITPARAAIGIFVALALAEATAPLRRAMSELGRMIQAARRVSALLDATPPRDDAPDGTAPTPGALEFDGVTFRRRAKAQPVLENLGLRVEPGEWLALAGHSGSGKSTALLLAGRLLGPDAGTISLGGRPIADWDATRFRAAVTLVPQRAALIEGSIADNLRLAAPGADDATLGAALAHVALDDVVTDKGGLDAPLGPRGAGLSGGEARRLVLARALLRAPDVLLLDEPTEGLDADTARRVLSGLRATLPQAAVIVAAHRREELEFCDRVLRLGPGMMSHRQK